MAASRDVLSRMFWPVARAELRAGLGRPLLYLCAAVFFLLAFQTIAITSPTASGVIRIGPLWHDSPYIVAKLMAVLSVVATLAAAVLIGPAVHRDYQHRTHELFLAAPITRLDYLLGRFTGACLATALVFLAATAGILAAALSIPPEFVGPFRLAAFIEPMLVFAVPNLLLTGAICFAVATLSRSMLTAYIAAVVTMMVLGIGQGILDEALQKGMVGGAARYFLALAEPFGGGALQIATAVWSPAERNTRTIAFLGPVLFHRVVWVTVALGLLGFTCRRFQPIEAPGSRPGWIRRWRGRVASPDVTPASPTMRGLRSVTLSYTMRQRLRQYAVLTMRELGLTVRHLVFIVLAAATLANLNSNFVGNVRAQGIHPRTGFFIEYGLKESSFVIILTIFFAGVLMWRERGHRTHEIVDSQPLPDALIGGSRLSALLLMQTAYAALVVTFGIFAQVVFFRYTHVELDVYLAAVFGVNLLGWWAIAVVAFVAQAVSPNVYAGYALSALLIGAATLLPAMGVADGLWRPGFTPEYAYSDMNGFGHFAEALFWYRVYWSLASVCLVIVGWMLWPRGSLDGIVRRLRTVRRGMTARRRATLSVCAVGVAVSGAFIFYNTDVLNGGTKPQRVEALRASYERAYRRFLTLEQPSVETVDVSADFFPRERRVAIRGTMTLRNLTSGPIRAVHVTLLPTKLLVPPRLEVDAATSDTLSDSVHGYSVFTLSTPLSPGATVRLRFEYAAGARGFGDESSDGHLVRNGSIVLGTDPEYFPQVGYRSELELVDVAQRVRHGLPGASSSLHAAADRPSLELGAPRWVGFSGTVSTDRDQQPVANGRVVREWVEGDRRYGTFASDNVAGRTFALASGAYARTSEWMGPVEVEILYHPDHADNLRSMFAGVRCGLEYGALHFGPYPQEALRIVELPMYTMQGNARAMSGLVLWGEQGGFITDVGRDAGIDRVYSTAAHETAHQWWGGSVRVLNEALSDYVRLACLEESFGPDQTADFVREGTRSYFRQRGRMMEEWRPLRDGGQYDSGYALMWRLRRLLGETVVNDALHDVVGEFGNRPDRTPAPSHVAEAIRRHAPPEFHPIVTDVFDHITLHPIRAREAWSRRLADGRYRVTLSADLRKSYGNAKGEDIPAPLDGYVDYIDVGVYGEGGRTLTLVTHRITDPRGEVTMLVDGEPGTVVLDPLGALLDPDPSDNTVTVRPERQAAGASNRQRSR